MKSILISLLLSLLSYTTTFAQEKEAPAAPVEKGKWGLQDYKRFKAYLNTLPLDAYPTLKNEKTKAIFQKVISSDYKDFLRDEAISLEVKMPYVMSYHQSMIELLRSYLMAYMKEKKYGIELAYIQGVSIDISAEIIPLIKELIKTFDKNDETYQVRMNGLKQMRFGLKQQLEGAWINIRDIETSTDEERIILTTYFSKAAVPILKFIESSDKKEFITKMKKYIPFEPNPKVKELLKELLSKLN